MNKEELKQEIKRSIVRQKTALRDGDFGCWQNELEYYRELQAQLAKMEEQ